MRSQNFTRGRILVVDDEEAVQQVAKQMLEQKGHDVLSAFDGKSAIEVIKTHPNEIDCVLLDLMMPKMNGIEALSEIHAINPDIPIILTSGFDERNFLAKFPDPPSAGFIQKPFQMRELLDAIEDLISS